MTVRHDHNFRLVIACLWLMNYGQLLTSTDFIHHTAIFLRLALFPKVQKWLPHPFMADSTIVANHRVGRLYK